jgi:hypothetical protein
MTFGDFIVSKQVGFQAIFVKRLWDSSDAGGNGFPWLMFHTRVVFCLFGKALRSF